MKTFTVEELKKFNGKGVSLSYIVFEGKVYDVTDCPNWSAGEHFEHTSGRELTSEMAEAPHADEVFEGIKCVGKLKENS